MKEKIDLKKNVIIYGDGACSGNPGPGGWGAIVGCQGKVYELAGRDSSTTNNRMEISAILYAFLSLEGQRLSPQTEIYILTDSTYLIRAMTQWVWGWRRNGWKTADGAPVQNQDLLEQLLAQLNGYKNIQWRYVRGHQGTPGNERCDRLAVAGSQGIGTSLFDGKAEDYIFEVSELPEQQDIPEMKGKADKKVAFSYLSLIGSKVVRHSNWASCERRVKGQSGAKFKKANSQDEEKTILKSWGLSESTEVQSD